LETAQGHEHAAVHNPPRIVGDTRHRELRRTIIQLWPVCAVRHSHAAKQGTERH